MTWSDATQEIALGGSCLWTQASPTPRRRVRMTNHEVRVYPSSHSLPREEQLAWKIAAVAADPASID